MPPKNLERMRGLLRRLTGIFGDVAVRHKASESDTQIPELSANMGHLPSKQPEVQLPQGTGREDVFRGVGFAVRARRSLSVSRRASRQRDALQRIKHAKNNHVILNISKTVLKAKPAAERIQAVEKSYRELSRLVHPDKCSVEQHDEAKEAFVRLQEAKNCLLEAAVHEIRNNSHLCKREKRAHSPHVNHRRGGCR